MLLMMTTMMLMILPILNVQCVLFFCETIASHHIILARTKGTYHTIVYRMLDSSIPTYTQSFSTRVQHVRISNEKYTHELQQQQASQPTSKRASEQEEKKNRIEQKSHAVICVYLHNTRQQQQQQIAKPNIILKMFESISCDHIKTYKKKPKNAEER